MTWDMHPHQTGHAMVESDRIHGRPVFDRDGVYIGRISRLLIDRRSGHVENVVVHAQGRFGLGQKDVDVLWHSLQYDTRLPGYRAKARFMDVVARSLPPKA